MDRTDGLLNVVNGLNTLRYDPSRHTGIVRTQFITKRMSENLFIENGIFRKIVTAPVDEALRAGFTIKEADNKINENLQSTLEDLDFETKFATALYWDRCYGGAVLFPVFQDGNDLTEPLNENRIQSIDEIRVYSAKEVLPMTWNNNIHDIRYRKPETYIIDDESNGACFDIHASRLIVFDGLTIPNVVRNERDGWGGMILEQLFNDIILKYDTANKYAIDIMERMAQGVLSIDGLESKLAIDGGEEEVKRYLQMIDMVRNILNTLAIDSRDSYDIKGISLSGISDILDKTQTMLSAAAEIPVTILFGRSPGGENATGEADFQQYYAMVQRLQRRTLKTRLSRFIYLLSKCKSCNIALPENWTINFNPLSIPTEKEQAETAKLKAEKLQTTASALNTLVSIGALDPIEVRTYLEEQGFKLDRTLDLPPGDLND